VSVEEVEGVSACEHFERATRDKVLSEHDQAPRSIIRRYRGLSRIVVQRHRDECLAAGGVRS
jgi:hypothetical protein